MCFRTGAAVLLAAGATSCSGRLPSANPSAVGEAVDALAGAYCITDVQADGDTVHLDSPRWRLEAAEGTGPRVLALTVAGYAAPLVNTAVTPIPKVGDVSAAVGYGVGEFYYLQASAALNVDDGNYRRLEAYINYARSTWVVRDVGCGAVLGAGTSFKPIGVYFVSHDAASAAIPGSSLVSFVPGCSGGPCGYPLSPEQPDGGGP